MELPNLPKEPSTRVPVSGRAGLPSPVLVSGPSPGGPAHPLLLPITSSHIPSSSSGQIHTGSGYGSTQHPHTADHPQALPNFQQAPQQHWKLLPQQPGTHHANASFIDNAGVGYNPIHSSGHGNYVPQQPLLPFASDTQYGNAQPTWGQFAPGSVGGAGYVHVSGCYECCFTQMFHL